jgi:DNA-directed RNA polymerase subunit K/omega
MAAELHPESPESAPAQAEEPFVPAPPIDSRFLFVDVAAQRAKQLRRGALARLPELKTEGGVAPRQERFFKLERVAMEEVSRGLVSYTLPEDTGKPEGHL